MRCVIEYEGDAFYIVMFNVRSAVNVQISSNIEKQTSMGMMWTVTAKARIIVQGKLGVSDYTGPKPGFVEKNKISFPIIQYHLRRKVKLI